MKVVLIALFTGLLMALAACSAGNDFYYDKSYGFRFVPNTWKKEMAKESDHAYLLPGGERFHAVSLCDYYEDKTLNDITYKKLKSLQANELIKQLPVTTSEGKLSLWYFTTKMFEKSAFIMLANIKDGDCYYEVTLVSPEAITQNTENTFISVLKSIEL